MTSSAITMNRPSRVVRALLRALMALALGAVLAPAGAEVADKDQPVTVEADKVTVDDARQTSVFEGSVVVTQGSMQLRADRIVVTYDDAGFKAGTAHGNQAYFRQKRAGTEEVIEGFGDRVEYDARAQTLVLVSRARIKRGEDDVRGSRITYNAVTEQYTVVGGKDSAAEGGRVRAVIQPKSRGEGAQPAPGGKR